MLKIIRFHITSQNVYSESLDVSQLNFLQLNATQHHEEMWQDIKLA